MTSNGHDPSSTPAPEGSAARFVQSVLQYDGPPQQFLAHMLAQQCLLAEATAAAILKPAPDGKHELLALHPPLEQNAEPPQWIASAFQCVANRTDPGATSTHPLHSPNELYGQPPRQFLISLPIRGQIAPRALAVFLAQTSRPDGLVRAQ